MERQEWSSRTEEGVGRAESRVHRDEARETLGRQCGADDQDHGEPHFDDDERASEALPGAPHRRA